MQRNHILHYAILLVFRQYLVLQRNYYLYIYGYYYLYTIFVFKTTNLFCSSGIVFYTKNVKWNIFLFQLFKTNCKILDKLSVWNFMLVKLYHKNLIYGVTIISSKKIHTSICSIVWMVSFYTTTTWCDGNYITWRSKKTVIADLHVM